MSPPRRLFMALGLPGQDRQRLADAVDALAIPDLRATARANYHLTLVFIGDIDTERLDDCRRTLTACAPAEAPLLQLDRIAPFPAPASRLLAAHIRATPVLEALQRCLAERLGPALNAGEQHRPWRPHITLGRMPRNRPAPASRTLDLTFPAAELGLYEGIHSASGYRYQHLQRHVWDASQLRPKRSSRAGGNRG